jgi:hypothetical protein
VWFPLVAGVARQTSRIPIVWIEHGWRRLLGETLAPLDEPRAATTWRRAWG